MKSVKALIATLLMTAAFSAGASARNSSWACIGCDPVLMHGNNVCITSPCGNER